MKPTQKFLSLSLAALFATQLAACADAPVEDEGAEPEISEAPLSDLEALLEGAPDNATLPDEAKADQVYPKQFDVADTQSPVKSQASRGVCSIFSTIALMEHLYIKEGSIPNPDFSEQMLQWSVKVEVGAFTNTSGSNASRNIEALNRFGTVEESVWPYQGSPWSTVNDPKCTGESQPTICHTNGNPSDQVKAAKRWKLPAARYVSSKRQNIKAFMFQNQVAVTAGMEFFYQSWNHGRSKLPVNKDYSAQGYVLYPNAEDKVESRKAPAGHSILIVGWDDDLEVPIVDAEGKQVLNADGTPKTEKGFFLIKNSWGTGGFGARNPFGAGYGWISMKYVEEFASINGADVPRVVLDTEICDDGKDNNGDRKSDCTDPLCAQDAACIEQPEDPAGDTLNGINGDITPIPDQDEAGIRSTIEIAGTATVGAVTVEVDISHTYRSDLTVAVVHPDGTRAVLHDREGRNAVDLKAAYEVTAFAGKGAAGTWTLEVVDHLGGDEGTLNAWSLEIAPR